MTEQPGVRASGQFIYLCDRPHSRAGAQASMVSAEAGEPVADLPDFVTGLASRRSADSFMRGTSGRLPRPR